MTPASSTLTRVTRLLECAFSTQIAPVRAQDASPTSDLVVAGGRLIDPETGLDAISEVPIQGDVVIDARGSRPVRRVVR